jgi:hypothetical protein
VSDGALIRALETALKAQQMLIDDLQIDVQRKADLLGARDGSPKAPTHKTDDPQLAITVFQLGKGLWTAQWDSDRIWQIEGYFRAADQAAHAAVKSWVDQGRPMRHGG